jgi:hypothetical protein
MIANALIDTLLATMPTHRVWRLILISKLMCRVDPQKLNCMGEWEAMNLPVAILLISRTVQNYR